MFVKNHTQEFRPLVGGISVQNPIVRKVGTLGCVLTSDGADRWIVSCYHVLARQDLTPYAPGEEIFQPAEPSSPDPVARMTGGRADPELDIAAAEVLPGIATTADILTLGELREAREPAVGMRVVKSGVSTGVTEGRISGVAGDRVEIELLPGFPPKYQLSFVSDSGSVWVDRETRAGVALHFAGNNTGAERAFGVPFPKLLEVLGLRTLRGQ